MLLSRHIECEMDKFDFSKSNQNLKTGAKICNQDEI